MKEKLHPGARWLFRMKAYSSLLFLIIILAFVIGPSSVILAGSFGAISWLIAIVSFLVLVTFILIMAEVYARLSYKFWNYEIGEDNIRLERGIIWKRYSNVPYERIQNVDIHRGIIARIFGFSSLLIQTAGYSMPVNMRAGGYHSEGYIPAVEENQAEKIREHILKKLKHKRQGL